MNVNDRVKVNGGKYTVYLGDMRQRHKWKYLQEGGPDGLPSTKVALYFDKVGKVAEIVGEMANVIFDDGFMCSVPQNILDPQ